MSNFWDNKRVCITGGGGFIGQSVVNALRWRGVAENNIIVPRREHYDLCRPQSALACMADCQVVFHLAAATGGIQYSTANPASQYHRCMLMTMNVMEAARLRDVEKFVGIGNILAYPADAPMPLEEESLFRGKVAGTHLGIGQAKRDMVAMCEMYHKQYGLNAMTILAANAYGPGDRFDPELAHVIPATIMKCHDYEALLRVWGDGTQTRDFMYVDDIAEGLLLAAEKQNVPQYHLNLSWGLEISIRELVRWIAHLCQFKQDIVFDDSKAGGDVRRVASGRLAREVLGFEPKVGLEEGLIRTINWYRSTL